MSTQDHPTEDTVPDFSTPIKSVDESLTTTERLTENAAENILPSRYLLDDETPDELFQRVAHNVAAAEAYYTGAATHDATLSYNDVAHVEEVNDWADAFYEEMSTLRFMPNSPTLMNAGAELQQLSACISGDTPIYTRDGLKPMAEIEEGDEVLTHTGRFKRVTAHWSNGMKETLDVKRGTSRGENYSVTATADHEFLTPDGWTELQDAEQATQPMALPDVSVPGQFDLTKYTSTMGKNKPVVSDGGVVKVQNSDDPRTGDYDKQYSEVVASVENNDTFAYIAGAFLAEGDVDGTDIRFTIGADENEFEQRIVAGLEELFDVHVAVMESNHGNWKTITASSPFITDLFITLFGTGSTEKRVPEWVFAASDSYQQAVLNGILDGDGHESENGWKLTLANPTLAYEASLLARNLDYQANFTLDAENELSANPTSRVIISKDSEKSFLQNVSTRSGETQEVFDMEVEDDHSFVAGDFIAHNCFVLEVGDSMAEPDEFGRQSILDAVKHAGQIFKSGGGVGYTFSHLRPKGAYIQSTDSETSGPMAFMRLFDEVCETVKQGGKRRGAQMAIMRCDHPDIGRFAVSKRNEGAFSNFNISVAVTDEFREAVSDDKRYTLLDPQERFEQPFLTAEQTKHFYSPEYEDAPESLVDENLWRDYADELLAWDWENGETVSFSEKWKDEMKINPAVDEPYSPPARFIWDLILDGAWRNGEPGLFYMDETNRKHSFDTEKHPEYEIHATNPCAEQPLCDYEACNLGHVNLSLMMEDDAETFDEWLAHEEDYERTESAVHDYMWENVDWEQLQDTVHTGVRFLDNVIDMSEFPLEEIDETVNDMRKIGLGLMGWAQMLYQMGMRYGSHESLEAGRLVMNFIDKEATEYSHELAKERGSFGAWEDSKYASPTDYEDWFFERTGQFPSNNEGGYEMRNHNVTTVAPTGTTSMIADTTGGIEPAYNVAYKKNVGSDIQGAEKLVEFDDYFIRTLEANEIDPEPIKEEIADLMDSNDWESVQQLDSVPDEIANLFVTTNDIPAAEHGMMQRAFQEKNDSGISKTINLPNEATHADVHNAYMLALAGEDEKFGAPIKGLTVYRDNSRKEQVLMRGEYTDRELEQAQEKLEAAGYTVTEPEEQITEQEAVTADD